MGRPKEARFNKYFPTIWAAAQQKGFDKKQVFLKKAGYPKQRGSDWEAGRTPLTAIHFVRLLEIAGLTVKEVEKRSGIALSIEERETVGNLQFAIRNPRLMRVLRQYSPDQLSLLIEKFQRTKSKE